MKDSPLCEKYFDFVVSYFTNEQATHCEEGRQFLTTMVHQSPQREEQVTHALSLLEKMVDKFSAEQKQTLNREIAPLLTDTRNPDIRQNLLKTLGKL